jgi:hypothetical protein
LAVANVYRLLQWKSDELKVYIQERQALTKEIMAHAVLLRDWVNDKAKDKQEVENEAKSSRREKYVSSFQVGGDGTGG